MKNFRNYLQLHLNILLFSLTSVFSKLASIQYNRNGLHAPLLYVFLLLMIANCGIYAIAWQQVIKKFSLSTAYANKRHLPSVVADLGSDHLSRTAFPTEHSGNPDRIIWSMDGAAL